MHPYGEEGYLLNEGLALPVLAHAIRAAADVAGAPAVAALFRQSGLALADFLGEMDREEEGAAEGIVSRYKLDCLDPLGKAGLPNRL